MLARALHTRREMPQLDFIFTKVEAGEGCLYDAARHSDYIRASTERMRFWR